MLLCAFLAFDLFSWKGTDSYSKVTQTFDGAGDFVVSGDYCRRFASNASMSDIGMRIVPFTLSGSILYALGNFFLLNQR